VKGLVISLGVFVVFSCKAQEYPLNADHRNIPNYSYLKDLNNELDPYIGNYKTNFQGNEINLFITKETHKLIEYTNKKFYRDILSVKYIIKNSSGIILQNTQNMVFQSNQLYFKIYSTRINPYQNLIMLNYSGTNCGIGWGGITLKKLNATQISWAYDPNSSLIDDDTCPPGTDKKVYLPVTKDLIFTKQ
jgi:hypothetical protein